MQTSTFFTVFLTFSKNDRILFQHFLDSPYLNGNRRAASLYAFLVEFYTLHKVMPDREAAYQQLYPGKPYHGKSMNALLSELVTLVEQFLMQEFLKNKRNTRDHLLRKALLEKGLLQRFQRQHKNLSSRLKNQTRRGFDYYEAHFLAQLDFQEYEAKKWGAARAKYSGHLQDLMDAWDKVYLIRRLIFSFEMENLNQILPKYSFDEQQLKNVLELAVHLNKKENTPIVEILLSAISSIESLDHKSLEKYLKMLDQYNRKIPKAELNEFYTYAINNAIRCHLSAKGAAKEGKSYIEVIFDIYLKMNEEGILFPSKNIALGRLKNVIAISLKVGQLEWAAELLDEIKSNTQQEAYQLNLANIRYHQKNYTEANHLIFLLLNGEKIQDSYLRDARHLQIKILFDQAGDTYSEYLLDTVNSFKAYIRSNKAVSTINKKAYRNFCTILVALHRRRTGDSVRSLEELRERLEGYGEVSDVVWLRERIF